MVGVLRDTRSAGKHRHSTLNKAALQSSVYMTVGVKAWVTAVSL
jgi:hypothetical protein